MALTSLMYRPNDETGLIGLSVFGSYGRGDFDAHSDLDLLAVVRDGSGTTPETFVANLVEKVLPKRPSVSFYGEQKLRGLFEEGNLFAWHLFLEASAVPGFTDPVASFGTPNPYLTAAEDIDGLAVILGGVPRHITNRPQNAVFEFGILYVCARNIAMSASWHLNARPEFGRYSPFQLSTVGPFPLNRDVYDVAMKCRMSSTRGEQPPFVTLDHVVNAATALIPWAAAILEAVRKK